MAGFDFELANLPLVGPMFFEEPGQAELQKQLAATAAAYEAQRPVYQDARMQGLQQALGMFGPAADMLGAMYGIRPPLEQAYINPMRGPDGGVPALGSPENNARLQAGGYTPSPQEFPPEVPPQAGGSLVGPEGFFTPFGTFNPWSGRQ